MGTTQEISNIHAAALADAYDSGDIESMPLPEYLSMAMSATQGGGAGALTGRPVPPDYDPRKAFAAMAEYKIGLDVKRIFDDVSSHSSYVEDSYHSINSRMMSASTGASQYDLETARISADAGDPSMLTKIYGDYLESF